MYSTYVIDSNKRFLISDLISDIISLYEIGFQIRHFRNSQNSEYVAFADKVPQMPWRLRVMIILRYLIHSEFKWIGNVLNVDILWNLTN